MEQKQREQKRRERNAEQVRVRQADLDNLKKFHEVWEALNEPGPNVELINWIYGVEIINWWNR
jgi:hypothetical protein